MKDIKYLVVHCTATKEGKPYTIEQVRQWHLDKGWSDIGYHYLIDLDGCVHKGRPDIKQGAHVRGYNKNSLGIVYVGGLDSNGKAKDTRTEAQKHALECILNDLSTLHPQAVIQGHRDFSPDTNKNGVVDSFERIKECPCFDAKIEYNHISNTNKVDHVGIRPTKPPKK